MFEWSILFILGLIINDCVIIDELMIMMYEWFVCGYWFIGVLFVFVEEYIYNLINEDVL